MVWIILIALAVVGLGLFFLSWGVGVIGWIFIIGGVIFVCVLVGGGIGKIKDSMPKKTTTYTPSKYSSSSGSNDTYQYEGKMRDEVKYNLRNLSGIYWGSVDSSSSGDEISITVHYSMKNNGYNYCASESDVGDAIGNAVRSAIKKTGCPYSVNYYATCDEVYTNI
ncbi:MAG: hypothetical protein K5906_04865 [Bacilli bacterium]|nr:hypothetical protein [Bacilli bacterium]